VSDQPRPEPRSRRWAWPLLIVVLAAAGVLLALGDIAVGQRWPNPLAVSPGVGAVAQRHPTSPATYSFDRTHVADRFNFASPLSGFGPINPYQALRALLTNGAGLVLLALGALVVFPGRARTAVERIEDRYGAAIAAVAGLVAVLLTFAAIILLRFTLLFLTLVPLLLLVALVAALFGVACISLAIGRVLQRGLRLQPVHPLVAALAGALVVFDLAVIPYAGVFLLGAVAMAGLGLAIVTRFGSMGDWSFADLSW
jgi:hypothetical protein